MSLLVSGAISSIVRNRRQGHTLQRIPGTLGLGDKWACSGESAA